MHRPVTKYLRHARGFSKAVTAVVLAAFLSLTLQPLALAANLPAAPKATAKATATATDPSAQLAQTLEATEAKLGELIEDFTAGRDTNPRLQDVKQLHQQLKSLDQAALQSFAEIETHLKAKALPPVILDRHTDAVKSYAQDFQTLTNALTALEAAPNTPGKKQHAEAAFNHLKEKQKKRGRPPFDPNDLPNKSLQPNPANKPKLTKAQFIQAGLTDNPTVKLAAHGTFTFDKLPGASDPAYLAATAEVTLTPAIQAKAAELDHNPVKIYNWVRNNVEWLPTWGATQDADVTLGSKRGNAFDIASLLIALYRASGIPARYVHGTIEVSADRFMNWAGGFTSITAAANYVSSGGIPVTTVVSGGKITKVQLEHVWVEAAIDFYPSRGAINKSADSWIQLETSFKQYQDLSGVDVVAVSGIDPNVIAQSFANSGTINQTEGWVSGLNPAILQTAQTQAQTALKQHIQNNLPNATVGDVIGGRRIVQNSNSVLPTGLPYQRILTGAKYGTLPSPLQNAMTFAFGTDILGDPINPVTFPWAKLNNHKVTLSFKPATAADEQTLNSLLPDSITDETQLPGSIPAYLIYVVPELSLDGGVIGRGIAMRLGEDLPFVYRITRAGGISDAPYIYRLPAGSYLNIPVIGGSISPVVARDIASRLGNTQATFATDNATFIGTLSREDVLGDLFHAGAITYFGQNISLNESRGIPQQARHSLPIGYGSYGYEPEVRMFFGFPRAVEHGGVGVNIRLAWATQSLDGELQKWKRLNLESGMLSSALEHGIPELLDPEPIPADGISAVKALNKANAAGQRVYHLTPSNQSQTLPNLRLDSLSTSEIQAALAVGKEVITHTDLIAVPGWRGAGYIILDPATGSGAYKITGGKNGGFQQMVDGFVFSTAMALGYVDGKIGQHANKAYIFSDQLKYLSKLAKSSAALGILALLVSMATVLHDEKLSASQKLGQIAMEMLGFGITTYVTAAAVALVGAPISILIALLVAAAMLLAVTLIKAVYFSNLRLRTRVVFA